MRMIGHAADLEEDAALLADDPSHVFVGPLASGVVEEGDAVFRAEDDVNQEIGERVCHREGVAPPGLMKLLRFRTPGSPRLRRLPPGYMLAPRRGAEKSDFLTPGSLPPGYMLWPLRGRLRGDCQPDGGSRFRRDDISALPVVTLDAILPQGRATKPSCIELSD